jgi:hypothetical protein
MMKKTQVEFVFILKIQYVIPPALFVHDIYLSTLLNCCVLADFIIGIAKNRHALFLGWCLVNSHLLNLSIHRSSMLLID